MDFLFEQEGSLGDQDLLDNGNDRDITFLANRRDCIDGLVERNTLDFDTLVRELFVDEFVVRARHGADMHSTGFHSFLRDLQLLRVKGDQGLADRMGYFGMGHFDLLGLACGLGPFGCHSMSLWVVLPITLTPDIPFVILLYVYVRPSTRIYEYICAS